MTTVSRPLQDLVSLAKDAGPHPARRSGAMASGLLGSEILKIAAEIRTQVAGGKTICNLTVGDFDPKHFPIPEMLLERIVAALRRGHTNYPPSSGMMELRESVGRFYERELGLKYPLESILIAGGARPVIHATYTTLCDPGDRVVYPVPSWNNNHYCHMAGVVGVPVPCGPETRFLPTVEAIASNLPGARLVCVNSPLNPTGTAIAPEQLSGICEAILEENRGRETRGERPVYLMYDHIYWMLCVGGVAHVTPPELHPEMARYTIFVDGSMITSVHGAVDGDANNLPGGEYSLMGTPANGLFRYFGDANGDGTVSASDFIQFRLAFGGSSSIFDFDGDGAVATSDFIQFRLRFGGSI